MPDMPFASEAQRRWMYANHPEMAKEWEAHTPSGKLPEHVKEGAKNAPAPPSDPTAASLQKILSGPDYETIPNVPVLDEHDEHDDKGKLVRRFTRGRLEAIAHATNQRESDTGDLVPFGPGHTIDDAPETAQPPPWGFYRNFRVGKFGPKNKTCLLADMVVKKAQKAEALTYPRRSIELWTRDNIIDWVALLRRTPERDLGLLTFSKDRGVFDPGPARPVYYDRKQKRLALARESPAGKLRYARDFNVSQEYDASGSQTDADKDAKEAKKFQKFVQRMERYEAWKAEKLRYQAGPGMPGAGNVAIPTDAAVAPRKAHEPPPDMTDEKARLQKEAEILRFSRMEQQVQQLQAQAVRSECEAMVRGLLYEGYELDPVAEIDALASLPKADREAHCNYLRKFHRKDPTSGSYVRLAAGGIDDRRETTRDARDLAVRYATQNGVSYDEAKKHIGQE